MFRKSTYSNSQGNCVEVDNWRKSSHSDSYVGAITCVEAGSYRKSTFSSDGSSMACIEAGHGTGIIAVRDTQDRGGFTLEVGSSAWNSFIARVKAA